MNLCDVAARLETRFGLGTQPTQRRALYRRLELLVQTEGERAYLVIAGAAQDADRKQSPGRYFSRVVCVRLQERGIVPSPEI